MSKRGGLKATGVILGVGILLPFAQAHADAIPYPSVGTVNTATYTFTAATTGDVIAYFGGSTASYDNQLGLLINGVSTGVIGLDNHTSKVGQSLDLGHATAGATLTFVLQNNTLNLDAYSNPALNVSYDIPSYTGSHQHVYSTPYTQTSPILDGIPSGVYVAFEDGQFPYSDLNYNDETFVFTNVSTGGPITTPEPGSLYLIGAGLAMLVGLRRREPRTVVAA